MRRILRTDESRDRTGEQREFRLWLRENRHGFMSKLADLEKAVLTAAAKAGPGTAVEDDRQPRSEPDPVREELTQEKVDEWLNRFSAVHPSQ
jgi:hypothetical protein